MAQESADLTLPAAAAQYGSKSTSNPAIVDSGLGLTNDHMAIIPRATTWELRLLTQLGWIPDTLKTS